MNVRELLLRLPDVVEPPAGAPDAVIQFATAEPVNYVLKGGHLSAHAGNASAPDVTIRVSDENLLRLLKGELNPMTAMMTGRLRVRGNVALAQRLMGMVDKQAVEEVRASLARDIA